MPSTIGMLNMIESCMDIILGFNEEEEKASFFLCDCCVELISKHYLKSKINGWDPKNSKGNFKLFKDILDEVKKYAYHNERIKHRKICEYKGVFLDRRNKRNQLMHDSSSAAFSINYRDCYKSIHDLLKYGELLFENSFTSLMTTEFIIKKRIISALADNNDGTSNQTKINRIFDRLSFRTGGAGLTTNEMAISTTDNRVRAFIISHLKDEIERALNSEGIA